MAKRNECLGSASPIPHCNSILGGPIQEPLVCRGDGFFLAEDFPDNAWAPNVDYGAWGVCALLVL